MAEVVDQENTSGAIGIGFGDSGSNRDYLCQGFIPTLNNVTAVSFYLNSVGSKGMKVWIDNANANSEPQGTVGVGIGGATEIPNASLVSGALTKYTLSSPVSVTPGNRYCICLAPWDTTTHVWSSDYRDMRSSTANPYANGRRVHLNGSFASPSAPDSGNADIQFRTYGDNAVSQIKKLAGAVQATLKKISSTAIASVKKIAGVTNV